MNHCHDFRARLGAAIEGHLEGAPLAWHEHLFSCADCRALFEAEEALDELLLSLPKPALPVALARRVLRGLAKQEERALDQTLDHALEHAAVEVPTDLAARVLAGVQAKAAGVSLDDVLDHLPEPTIPTGLSERITANLQREVLRPPMSVWRRPMQLTAAAALVVCSFIGYRVATVNRTSNVMDVDPGLVAHETTELNPDPELLASLDLLEDWELLFASDVDLLLGSLDETEQALLMLDQSVAINPQANEEEGG